MKFSFTIPSLTFPLNIIKRLHMIQVIIKGIIRPELFHSLTIKHAVHGREHLFLKKKNCDLNNVNKTSPTSVPYFALSK
jgi:hypothetical protein